MDATSQAGVNHILFSYATTISAVITVQTVCLSDFNTD